MTKTIPFTVEPHVNARWTVAALVNDKVVAFHQFNVADASELTDAEVWAVKKQLADLPEMQEDDDLPDDPAERFAALADMDDEDIVERRVVFGMVSGGRFTHSLNKGDLRRAGAGHLTA